MKSKNFKVAKMNVFGDKYEQLTILKEGSGPSWFNCHTGEWKKGFVQFVPEVVYDIDHYRVIIGDKEFGQGHFVAKKDKRFWQSTFESAGFEVRYVKAKAK